MRLTCPNCSAQYEVPDDVIPAGGRDVQCSNCEHTWFQAKEAAADAPAPETVKPAADKPAEPVASSTSASATPADTGNVDPAVAGILKEEAAREADLRAKEGSSLESQPDFALDTPQAPASKPKEPVATATAAVSGSGDSLPDVDAINSGLTGSVNKEDILEPVQAPRKSRGFLRGFGLIVILGVILLLVYGNANQISEAVPQAEPALQSYVSLVDQARIWLEAQTSGAAEN